jgi:hypothetical protein
MTETDPAAGYRPRPRWVQAVAGLFISAVGVGISWIVWNQAATRAEFSMRGALVGPAFAVLGLGLAAFGGYREERLARGESLEGLHGHRLITPRWWAVLALAFVAGGAYTFALSRGWLGR